MACCPCRMAADDSAGISAPATISGTRISARRSICRVLIGWRVMRINAPGGARLLGFARDEHGAARDAGVVAQAAGDNLDAFGGAGQGALSGFLVDDGEHVVLQLLDDAAAEDDALGVE